MVRRNTEAPGLKWRKRGDGTTVAYWIANGTKKAFWPRTIRIWSGTEPNAEELAQIKVTCRHWQTELDATRRPRNRLEPPDGDVYFLRGNGLIKIGFSKHPRRRFAELSQMVPYEVVMIGTMPGSMAVEKDLHALFAEDRVKGEWFRPSALLIAYIERKCGTKAADMAGTRAERGNTENAGSLT